MEFVSYAQRICKNETGRWRIPERESVMYDKIAKLIIYKEIAGADILNGVANCIREYKQQKADKEQTVTGLYGQMHKLLDLATAYGFDENLWQAYLAYLLAMAETPAL